MFRTARDRIPFCRLRVARTVASVVCPVFGLLLLIIGLLVFHLGTHQKAWGGVAFCGETAPTESAEEQEARERMVREQVMGGGIRDACVLEAMRKVPRHLFVPKNWQAFAYSDTALPIGYDQTISQPYIVAFMSEALELKSRDRVLEIGTGSGYQTAMLAHLAREVYSIEILAPLAKEAAERLRHLSCSNVHLRTGDGYKGWPEAAPFDAIIVTAAPDHVPAPLVEQLRQSGRLVLPLGVRYFQELIRLRRTEQGVNKETLLPVTFVPMLGEAQKTPASD